MNVKAVQALLNVWGIKDAHGKPLVVDGLLGLNTRYVIIKAKAFLQYILK